MISLLPISTLLKVMTEDEVFDRLIAIIIALGLPADKWRQGGALRVIVRACARLISWFTVLIAAFVASGFLETATGEGLTLLARNTYGVERRVATKAREKITLANTSSNTYDGNLPGSVIVFNEVTKKTYTNVDAFDLDPSTTIDVMFEATEAGSVSTSAAGQITGLETHFTGVSVTNSKAFIGLDDESDDDLKDACRFKLGSLSVRGPRTAYQWAIRVATLSDGTTPVNVNRSNISKSDSKGRVFIWLASPAGVPTSEDIAGVVQSVEDNARPDTVRVTVAAATPVTVTRTLDVWVKQKAGVSATDVKSTLLTAYTRQAAAYPVGGIAKQPSIQGKLYASWLEGVAKEAWPDTFDVDGAGNDVNLADGEVAVLDLTLNVHVQVAA